MKHPMKKVLLPLAAIAALVAACVPSVNPFYTDKDVITDARLAGNWVEDGDKEKPATWKFEAATNNTYGVTLTEGEGKTGRLEAHLFKLGTETFLDLTPTECNFSSEQAGFVNAAMIPGHLLVRVKLAEKKLNLAVCDPDWVKKFLAQNPSAVAHRVVDGNVIFTAETGALQKFVLQHLGQGELFSDGTDYNPQENTSLPK
jgi:hypothetical protein